MLGLERLSLGEKGCKGHRIVVLGGQRTEKVEGAEANQGCVFRAERGGFLARRSEMDFRFIFAPELHIQHLGKVELQLRTGRVFSDAEPIDLQRFFGLPV